MELTLGFIISAGIGVLSVIYVVYIAASVTREEMAIHDLRVSTHTLRNEYSKRLASMRDDTGVNVDVVSDNEAPEAPHAQAA